MSYPSEFLIENGILKEYYGAGGEIEIPDGVYYIAPFAFCYCEIEKIILPKSLANLKKEAFCRCRSLKLIFIPGSTMKFGKDVFSYAPGLPYVIAPNIPLGDMPPFVKANCCCGFAVAEEQYKKPATETYLKYIQHQRKSLYPAALVCDELLRLMIREKFITRDEAKELVSALSESGKTELSAELLRYQSANFKPVDPIKELMREANRDPYSAAEVKKFWEFDRLEDKTVRIRAYKGNEELVALPPRVGRFPVTEIGDLCFNFSNRPRPERGTFLRPIKQVFVPDSVVKIGKRAFDGCTELFAANIPEKVSEIPAGAFEDCRSLSEIEIPKGATVIGTRAFLRSGITELSLPKSVETVEAYAFSACKKLEKVSFDSGAEIMTEAFSDCDSLIEVRLEEGTKHIGYGAFGDCENLSVVYLPESLAEIGRNAFYGCGKLTIIAPKGSFAEEYAAEHRINFKETDTEVLK